MGFPRTDHGVHYVIHLQVALQEMLSLNVVKSIVKLQNLRKNHFGFRGGHQSHFPLLSLHVLEEFSIVVVEIFHVYDVLIDHHFLLNFFSKYSLLKFSFPSNIFWAPIGCGVSTHFLD